MTMLALTVPNVGVVAWRDALMQRCPQVPTAEEVADLRRMAVALAVPSPAEAEWAANAPGMDGFPVVVAPRPFRGSPSFADFSKRPFRHMVSCLCRQTPDLHERIVTDLYGHERDGMTTDKPWWQASWQLPPVGSLDRVKVVVVPHAGEFHGYEPPNLLDALAAGCCVIAQEFPGIDDLWRDGTDLVVWRKRQNAEKVLREVFADEGRMERIAKAGREAVIARTEERWQKRIIDEVAACLSLT